MQDGVCPVMLKYRSLARDGRGKRSNRVLYNQGQRGMPPPAIYFGRLGASVVVVGGEEKAAAAWQAGYSALCPLLGLMGTVTGMIEVFDVMAISGTGNARSMAAGVSKATIPTMAGMVGALSGVFLVTIISRAVANRVESLEDQLTMEH